MALGEVLKDIDSQGKIDLTVCLGDVALGGPKPRETVQKLMRLGLPTVLGNADDLSRVRIPATDDDKFRIQEIDDWSADQLSHNEKEYLKTFRPTICLTLGSIQVLCYHGSPRNYREGIFPSTPDEDLTSSIEGYEGVEIFAGGHTHQQMLRRFGKKIILNPGSVGMAFEYLTRDSARNVPWAEYLILQSQSENERSSLEIQFRRVHVDGKMIRAQILDSGMPNAEWWAKDWG